MALVRVSFFFKTRDRGWTETFYSTRLNVDQAMVDAKAMLRYRTNLLAGFVYLEYIRVSDDLVRGDALLYAVPWGDQGTKVPNSESINQATDGVEIRMPADQNHRRTFIMRGIRDNLQQQGVFVSDPQWDNDFPNWRNRIAAGNWGMKIVDTTSVLEKTITSLVNDFTGGFVTVTTSAAHGFANGDLVNIFGRMNCPGFRGLYRIYSVTADTFRVVTRRSVAGYNGLGKVRKQVYSIVPFTGPIEVVRLGKRDTGRPSFVPRGRRSAIPRA